MLFITEYYLLEITQPIGSYVWLIEVIIITYKVTFLSTVCFDFLQIIHETINFRKQCVWDLSFLCSINCITLVSVAWGKNDSGFSSNLTDKGCRVATYIYGISPVVIAEAERIVIPTGYPASAISVTWAVGNTVTKSGHKTMVFIFGEWAYDVKPIDTSNDWACYCGKDQQQDET